MTEDVSNTTDVVIRTLEGIVRGLENECLEVDCFTHTVTVPTAVTVQDDATGGLSGDDRRDRYCFTVRVVGGPLFDLRPRV